MESIFEQIKKRSADGVEYWDARELGKNLGYERFDSFKRLVLRVKQELEAESQLHSDVELHKIATNSPNAKETFYLSRLACYKISMLASTPEGVKARSYFAVQTRRQELADLQSLYGPELERIAARRKLTETEKELSELLHQNHLTGSEISEIRSLGDKVLFGGRTTKEMKARLGVKDYKPLADHLPTVLLKAKDLAAEMTTYNSRVKRHSHKQEFSTEHQDNNQAVRTSLTNRDIYPEKLPPEEDIKKVERKVKKEQKKLKSDKKVLS